MEIKKQNRQYKHHQANDFYSFHNSVEDYIRMTPFTGENEITL